jgi:hypothetical protein
MSAFDPLRTLASYERLRQTRRGAPMFRLIRLNPPNGWNAVAWELAIVVIGVLIALGAQQVVEELRWRDEVRLTEGALAIEIADSVLHASERQMVNRCLSDRLTHLIGKVSSNDGPWSGDPLPLQRTASGVKTTTPAAYRTPNRPWNDDVWVATQNAGVFSHMPRERVAAFAKVYARMEGLRNVNGFEHQVFPELLYLSFDTRLDAAARQRALATLGRLDWLNGTILLDGERLIEEVQAVRLDFSRTSLKRGIADVERTQRAFRGKCVQHFEVQL